MTEDTISSTLCQIKTEEEGEEEILKWMLLHGRQLER